jgi:hypothetical protein
MASRVLRLVFFHDVRPPQQQPTLIRIAPYGSVESGVRHVLIAVQRNGADRFAVLSKGLLLHSERKVLVDVGKTGMRHLPQEVNAALPPSGSACPRFSGKDPANPPANRGYRLRRGGLDSWESPSESRGDWTMDPDKRSVWLRKLDEECPYQVVLPRRQLTSFSPMSANSICMSKTIMRHSSAIASRTQRTRRSLGRDSSPKSSGSSWLGRVPTNQT